MKNFFSCAVNFWGNELSFSDILRTLWYICDRTFIPKQFFAVNYFPKKAPSKMIDKLMTRNCKIFVAFLSRKFDTPLSNGSNNVF